MDSYGFTWFIWIHIDSYGFILIHVDLSMSFCFGHWWSLQIWAQMDCLWTNRVWSGETCQDKPSSFPTAVGESHTFYDMNSPNDSGQDLFRFFVFVCAGIVCRKITCNHIPWWYFTVSTGSNIFLCFLVLSAPQELIKFVFGKPMSVSQAEGSWRVKRVRGWRTMWQCCLELWTLCGFKGTASCKKSDQTGLVHS